MPRLMVIMPARNAAGTVRVAVRSTLRALPRDARLTVLDDASDDATVVAVESVADARVTMLRSSTNLGVSAGLNHLLEQVDCQYVARMDADDVCLPWRLHQQLHLMGDLDASFTTVLQFATSPRRGRVLSPVAISPAAMRLHLLLANPVAHSTMLGRIDHLRRVGGYREVRSEDYDLWLRMSLQGSRLGRTSAPGLLYRIHPGQVTATSGWHRQAAADPGLKESYTALCEQVLGVRPSWYAELRARVHGAPKPPDPDISVLWQGIERRSQELGWRERRFLRSKRDRLVGPA